MDNQRFDAISRWFANGNTRRSLLGRVGALGAGATLATVIGGFTPVETEAASAKSKCRKRCKRRFDEPNQRRRKRKCIKKCSKANQCTSSTQCPNGQLCSTDNRCVSVIGCANDAQCGAGRECTNGQCVDSGAACTVIPPTCGAGQFCNVVTNTCQTLPLLPQCEPDGSCSGVGLSCVPVLNLCLPDLGICTAEGDCPADEICVIDACVSGFPGSCSLIGGGCESTADCCEDLLCLNVDLLPNKICVGL